MGHFTDINYHLVFATRERRPVLAPERRDVLLRYFWGIAKKRSCHVYRMNAVDDHAHILFSLHPTVCLADFVRDLKAASTDMIRRHGVFPGFAGWQDGYGAFTIAAAERPTVIRYIADQQRHHAAGGETSMDELRRMLAAAGVAVDERFFR